MPPNLTSSAAGCTTLSLGQTREGSQVVSILGNLRHIACRSTAYAVVLGAKAPLLDASHCNHNTKTETKTKINQLLPSSQAVPPSYVQQCCTTATYFPSILEPPRLTLNLTLRSLLFLTSRHYSYSCLTRPFPCCTRNSAPLKVSPRLTSIHVSASCLCSARRQLPLTACYRYSSRLQ